MTTPTDDVPAAEAGKPAGAPVTSSRVDTPEGRPAVVQRDPGQRSDVQRDTKRELAPWERDDAPKGSTEASLLKTDENGKVRVSGPTHYGHLVNGQIVPTYGIGTHHTDADYEDGAPVEVVRHY